MIAAVPAFAPEPADGRVYAARRMVRSTDVTPSGRLRLDALARYLQLAAEDDLADSGLIGSAVWLVRRCAITVARMPMMGERITLRTFCSATGPRWAERTTTLTGQGGGGDLLQATAVWAAVDRRTGRPVPPGEDFMGVYGAAAQGRTVSARLSHPRPAGSPEGRRWQLRASDFDTAGHVNNAIAWAAVEDMLAGDEFLAGPEQHADPEQPAGPGQPAAPAGFGVRAEVEYHRAILPGCQPRLATESSADGAVLWLLDGNHLLVSARLAGR
jgi:acyl-ACP thioesterase